VPNIKFHHQEVERARKPGLWALPQVWRGNVCNFWEKFCSIGCLPF